MCARQDRCCPKTAWHDSAYSTCCATRCRARWWDQRYRISDRHHQFDIYPTAQDSQHRNQYYCQRTIYLFLWLINQTDAFMQIHPYTQMALGVLTGAAQVRPALADVARNSYHFR